MPSDILKRYLLQRICTRETGDVSSLRRTPDLLSSNSEEDEAVRVNKRNVTAHPPDASCRPRILHFLADKLLVFYPYIVSS